MQTPWLLFIYRVPQEPAGRRTYVWRQLKQLGAIYLQQAAAILPSLPEVRLELERLAAWVEKAEGEVSLLDASSPHPHWEQDVISRFNRARDEEYQEIVENAERFEDEILRESRKGKFTFAELEDIEADWEKLQRWHGRVKARDFFAAAGRTRAEFALEHGRGELEGFAQQVYAQEGIDEANARGRA